MSNTIAPCYQTENGYLTQTTRKIYIKRAVEAGRLPPQARRMETITSLQASHDPQMPIQFWQLFCRSQRNVEIALCVHIGFRASGQP